MKLSINTSSWNEYSYLYVFLNEHSFNLICLDGILSDVPECSYYNEIEFL